MSLDKKLSFVGFGFGPIQVGLFIYEAYLTGNFDRITISEINPDLVSSVRNNNGRVRINIAHSDHIEHVDMDGIEIYDPNQIEDRKILVQAISEATEMSTAVPSVKNYVKKSPGSIHNLLIHGFKKKADANGPACVIYTAENNNRAAEILMGAVDKSYKKKFEVEFDIKNIQFVNTVIGKMCQVVGLGELEFHQNLIPFVPNGDRAILVESYNKILISKIQMVPDYFRGIEIFQEKDNLIPFEEVKLFAHNAIHAALGFLGACLQEEFVCNLVRYPELLAIIRSILINEVGLALCSKHKGFDELFTETGFRNFADDLLERMLNPYLMDSTTRLTRDIDRKLGWDDRLIGAMRLCLKQSISPRKLAFSVAAALNIFSMENSQDIDTTIKSYHEKWLSQSQSVAEVNMVFQMIINGIDEFVYWKNENFSTKGLLEIFSIM